MRACLRVRVCVLCANKFRRVQPPAGGRPPRAHRGTVCGGVRPLGPSTQVYHRYRYRYRVALKGTPWSQLGLWG